MTKKIFNFRRGFTVLETIIAIAVVSLAIAGATSAVRTGLVGASIAKEQVKAFYLTQEAIEVIRNKRDGNILANFNGTPTSWLAGISEVGAPCAPGNTCVVDASAYSLSNLGCSGWNSCPYLRQDPSAYLYGYNGSWTQTVFRREVQIENVAVDEINISVQVSWTHGAATRSFKTKAVLMKWF
ncbi:MAG: prepilin-type N-terminal cleavage/methylation domain-containing protein [Patescibacteria group bacterium]